MNKNCPKCRKRVTVKQHHIFHNGQRYHRECMEEQLEEERIQSIDTTIQLSKKDGFIELWNKGMEYSKAGHRAWQFRWCSKQDKAVLFSDLKGLECWKCDSYIGNEGNCDCL